MLRQIIKFLVVAILLVLPIICAHQFEADVLKLQIEGKSADNFRQQCKNVSGVDIDFERNYRLYQEYEKCIEDVVDFDQLEQDAETISTSLGLAFNTKPSLSDQEKSVVVAAIQKYCPNATSMMNCDNTLSPIYQECYTLEERKYKTFKNGIRFNSLKYICENSAVRGIQFVNERFLECANFKQTEIMKCVQYNPTILQASAVQVSTENMMCKSLENMKNCVVSKIEKCKLSTTLGTLLESLFAYVTTGVCDSSDNIH